MTENSETKGSKSPRLSSAKREDLWALIIAALVMLASIIAPTGVHTFFKKILYFF